MEGKFASGFAVPRRSFRAQVAEGCVMSKQEDSRPQRHESESLLNRGVSVQSALVIVHTRPFRDMSTWTCAWRFWTAELHIG